MRFNAYVRENETHGRWAKIVMVRLLAGALLLVLAASGRVAEATDPPVTLGRWINYGTGTTGFPPGSVTTVAVGGDERLWIGTDGYGIAVFDGSTWTRYTVANTSGGLVSDYINVVAADGDEVWVGTGSGVSRFDTSTANWTTYTTSNSDLPSNIVKGIAFSYVGYFPDVYRAQFFATAAGLAQRHNPNGSDVWHVYTTSNSGLISNNVLDVAVDEKLPLWFGDEVFWIVTAGGTHRVIATIWTTYTNATASPCSVIEDATHVAIDEEGGRVWFGTDRTWHIDPNPGQGACMFDTADESWHRFYSGNSALADDTVSGLAVDTEGRVWFGTAKYDTTDPGGVYVCTWANNTCYWQSYTTTDGLSSNKVGSVAASLDRVWFGTLDAGLSSFALHWRYYDTGYAALALASRPGSLWVGTAAGIRCFDGTSWTTELPSQEVRAILSLGTADAWAGTETGGAFHWNGSTWQAFDTSNSGLASNDVQALARDTQDRIWMGTYDAGVSVYNLESKGWATFNTGNSPLPTNRVDSLAVDSQGDVWVGTDNGLARYTGTAWYTYTVADGLPNPDIRALAVDKLGNVWAGTSLGAARWDGTSWTAHSLPIAGVRTISIDPTGKVWLGGVAGAAVFDGSEWTVYRARNSGLTYDDVWSIATDADGGVWFGTLLAYQADGGLHVRGTITEPLGLPSPTLSSFSPLSGVADTVVTIVGTNFDPRGPAYNTVEFRATGYDHWAKATVLSVGGTTTITAKVPPEAMQGPIRVKAAGGTATSSGDFDPLPMITSLSSSAGPVGAPIDIYGSNFDGPTGTEVGFGTSSWSSLSITQTHNHMQVRVPMDATTGDVKVRTASGTATSPSQFTVGNTLKIFGEEVHQGLPPYPLAAGKSTVVRIFVGTSSSTMPAYVDRAVLTVIRYGTTVFKLEATVANGGVPNKGWFSNTTKQVTDDGSIDFVIPGSKLSAGTYTFWVDLYSSYNLLASHSFPKPAVAPGYVVQSTGDLRIHASAPGSITTLEQLLLIHRSLTALARTYPIRDGYGPLGSGKGVQVVIRPYHVCDGTLSTYCKKTGYLWDFWQQNAAGQRRARTRTNNIAGSTDDGTKITWDLGTLKQGQRVAKRFFVRLRPASYFPVGTTSVAVTGTVDSASQAGSPDDTAAVSVNVHRSTSVLRSDAAPGSPAANEALAPLWDGVSRPAAPTAPNLEFYQSSVSTWAVFDADGSGNISPGDVIEYAFGVENKGDTDATNVTLVIDYDESHMALYGSGGLMLGSGSTFDTELIPGQFWSAWGWLPSLHDPPMDENYNSVIDSGDLAYFVAEFDDWNPTTGDVSVSTNLANLDPGEVIRNFGDANDNGKYDKGETRSQHVQRFDNAKTVLSSIPWNMMSDYNKTAPTSKQADFSALWFWKGINAFMGPGQGDRPGFKTWANVTGDTAVLHEIGHNTGQVQDFSPYVTPAKHSPHKWVPNVSAGYDIVGRRVLTGGKMLSVMYPFVLWPVEDTFFEPFEYLDMYKFFRKRYSGTAFGAVEAGPFFYISGVVSQGDEVEITDQYLTEGLTATPQDPNSSYHLLFLAGEEVVGEHRFPVNFLSHWDMKDSEDGEESVEQILIELNVASFDAVHPFPEGTTAVEVRHGSETLAVLEVSATAPWVHVLSPDGGEIFGASEEMVVEWEAGDDDGDDLSFAVRYSADAGVTWHTLTAGALGNTLTVTLDMLPGGDHALIEVEANDGFHTASDRSDAVFSVGGKAPLWAAVSAPADGDRLVQSQLVTLVGSAFDLEDGVLSGESLSFSSDRDGSLGQGEIVTVALTVGEHVITLEATDGDGLVASSQITIEMLADFDGDGLSDEYEQSQAMLAWWKVDDAGADPDEDGLTNRSEATWGTDPGNPDSDGDGVPDGEEVAGGSLPGDPEQQPAPPELLVSHTELGFSAPEGGPNPDPEQVLLMSSTPEELGWTAEASVPWLSVDPISGTTASLVTVGVEVSGLASGMHEGYVTFQGAGGDKMVHVHLEVGGVGPPRIYLPLVLRNSYS